MSKEPRGAAQQNSPNARALREKVPSVQLREFQDQRAGFQALMQGAVDAFTNDGIQLVALKLSAPNELGIVGEPYTEDPYAMAMRKGDAKFTQVVTQASRTASSLASTSPQTKAYLLKQIGT